MTKICGVVNRRGDDKLGQHLANSYQVSWQEGFLRRELWHDRFAGLGHASLGAVNVEPQPLQLGGGDDRAVYCGKIFDYAALERELTDEGVVFEQPGSEVELLVRLLKAGRLDRLAKANGVFALANWDQRNKVLRLVNDRCGFRPLFYYHCPQRELLMFSSDLRAIIESEMVLRELDWDECVTFLHLGLHLGTQTFFKGLCALPPASVLTFADNQVRIERYWDVNSVAVDRHMSLDTAIDGIISLFSQAIARRVAALGGCKTMVLMSGGKDSRTIAAELKRQGVDFTTYTTAGVNPSNPDKTLAKRVADVLGVENTYVDVFHDDLIGKYWRRSNYLVDYETALHQWMLPLADALPPEVKINFDGIAGDITIHAHFVDRENYAMACRGDLDAVALRVIEQRDPFRAFNERIRRRLSADIIANVRAPMERFRGNPHLITLFYITNRTRRAVALLAGKLVATKAESFCPYADNDLLDFTLSIPMEHKLDHRLHRRVLDRAFPQLKDIPLTAEIRMADYRRGDDLYRKVVRQRFMDNLRSHYIGKNWLFNNRYVLPRVIRDLVKVHTRPKGALLISKPPYTTFCEMLDRYFPQGV